MVPPTTAALGLDAKLAIPVPAGDNEKAIQVGTPDEKTSPSRTESERSFDQVIDVDFTEAEEARVRRKLDLLVMPLLFLGFYTFQLDRGNISAALSDGFLNDVGIGQDQFNTGQALLYLGIILLEVPSTYMLMWIGPNLWLSIQVFAFGFVSIFQAFQKGYGGYLGTRILLGVTECGYIPGALYILSSFYKRSEIGKRNSFFFLGNGIASATSGLLAYGILPLGRSRPQLKGWQWLFILEGSMTVFVAILLLLLLPASPHNPIAVSRFSIFTARERQILVARVVQEDSAKREAGRKLNVREIFGTLGNWRIWPHVLIAIALIAPTSAIGTYGPTLIKGFNFDTLTANALSSVGGWVGLFTTSFLGILTDKTNIRGPICIVAITCFWAFWIAFQQKSLDTDRWLKYGLIVMVQGFNLAYHPINATWLSSNVQTPQQRSIAMAMFVMAANGGALVGSQLLRADDAPTYRRGFKVCVALASFGLLTAILQHVQYRLSNARNERLRRTALESGEESGGVETEVPFKYTL